MDTKNIAATATIQPGAFIDAGVTIQDHVQVGANAVILGADQDHPAIPPTSVKAGAIVGAQATLNPGITIGERAIIRPGAVVTRSVPPLAIVEGHPAIIVGYRSTPVEANAASTPAATPPERITRSVVADVALYRFPFIRDLRGNLTVGEFEREVPFIPQRYFLVLDVPSAETRGEHAHKVCEQFLICVKGSCHVVADDGTNREEFILDRPNKGLYLPPMVWGIQYQYTADAVLLVFASHHYDPSDYIRDYHEFLALAAARRKA